MTPSEPLMILRGLGTSGRRAFAWAGPLGLLVLAGCGGSDVKCGSGTTKQGDTCVATAAIDVHHDAGTPRTDAGTAGSGGAPSTDAGSGAGGSQQGGSGGTEPVD